MKPRMPDRRLREAQERAAQSRRILEEAARDSETIGSSSLARTATRAREGMAGHDEAQDDAVVVWGRRIGRGLALLAIAGLLYHLLVTYVLA